MQNSPKTGRTPIPFLFSQKPKPPKSQKPQKPQKKRFNKGLKMLSVIVKDIVIDRGSTTYKEVAEIILKDSIKHDNLNLNTQREVAKEEQNIKRRVYDALNVLISAGILIKEGKKVRKNETNQKIIISNKRMKTNTLKSRMVF